MALGDTRNPKLPLPSGSYSSFTQTLLAGRWIDFALRLARLLYLGCPHGGDGDIVVSVANRLA
jgi:hypothetical protein